MLAVWRATVLVAIALSASVVFAEPIGLPVRPVAAKAPNDADPSATAAELISELGSAEYATRRRAEEELLTLGADAFDALKVAESSKDLEVSLRARSILQQLRIEWIRPRDNPDVQHLLADYSDLTDDGKTSRIDELSRLPRGAGLPALCRIARYDESALAARRAAVAILTHKPVIAKLTPPEECLAELGSSSREPVQWIRLGFREDENPRDAASQWMRVINAESALLARQSPTAGEEVETDDGIVTGIIHRQLSFCDRWKLSNELAAALERSIAHASRDGQKESLEVGLASAIQWIIENERWELLEPLQAKHAGDIKSRRTLLYYLAAAVRRAGREVEAQKLAKSAFEMSASDERQRRAVAGVVAALGDVDWAEREYRRIINQAELVSSQSLVARNDLGIWLADREDYQEAADLLGEFCDALDADKAAKTKFIDDLRQRGDGGEVLKTAYGLRRYYLACRYEQLHDYEKQRAELKKAVEFDARNPDILIAMYRSPGADQKFKEETMDRIGQLTRYQQKLIDDYPDVASFYNQWSWLVANTKGDYMQAVEYSKKSLELQPDEASFLDTLGRCYYAVGDLEKAANSQRLAVAKAPQYQVMKRQLAFFEKELAAKEKKQ